MLYDVMDKKLIEGCGFEIVFDPIFFEKVYDERSLLDLLEQISKLYVNIVTREE